MTTMTERKKKWKDALLSGTFFQTTGALTRLMPTGQTHYCCIGVYGEACTELDVLGQNDIYERFRKDFKGVSLSNLITFIAQNPQFGHSALVSDSESIDVFFWRLNDRLKMSFEDIALVIDQIPEE